MCVGPFPESPAGNTPILVVADYFTRWTETYPIPNQEATTVASKLMDEFFFPCGEYWISTVYVLDILLHPVVQDMYRIPSCGRS